MQDAAQPAPEPLVYHCPHCGGLVSVQETTQSLLHCPHCTELFSITNDGSTEHVPSDSSDVGHAPAGIETGPEAELSELRIRQVAGLRRGAYRSRSWLLMGACTCGVGFAQCVHLAVRDWRLGLRMGPATDLILAAAAVLAFRFFLRRIRDLNRELRESAMRGPATPPDLSSLSDGSQQWANLNELANGRDLKPSSPTHRPEASTRTGSSGGPT
jgi:hypothetical protein